MAKLLPNRISEVMTEAQQTQFIAGIKMALEALPKKPILPQDDYDKIPKKGDAREKEANQLVKIVVKYPKFLPSTLTVTDVLSDNTLYDQLNTLVDDHLQALVDVVDFLMGLSGGEEMNAYSRFIENVKAGVNDGNEEAIAAWNEISAIDRKTPGKTAQTTKVPKDK